MVKRKSIDGLKGIAAVIIACFFHYQMYLDNNCAFDIFDNGVMKGLMKSIYIYGYLAVEIFFILSGYGIYHGYYKRIKAGEISFNTFFWRRISKIMPLFILTSIIILIIQWYSFLTYDEFIIFSNNDLYSLAIHIIGLVNISGFVESTSLNGPAWFLGIILICYVLFFVIVYKGKRLFPYLCMLLMIIGIWSIRFDGTINFPFCYGYAGRGYLCFFGGALVAHLIYCLNLNLKPKIKRHCIAFGIFLIALWGAAARKGLLGGGQYPYITFAFYVGLGLVLLISFSDIFNDIFGNKFFCFLGKISFSVYLWHFVIYILVRLINDRVYEIDYSSPVSAVVICGLIIGWATFSYAVIEPRVNRMFDSLTKLFIEGELDGIL